MNFSLTIALTYLKMFLPDGYNLSLWLYQLHLVQKFIYTTCSPRVKNKLIRLDILSNQSKFWLAAAEITRTFFSNNHNMIHTVIMFMMYKCTHSTHKRTMN